MIDVVLLLVILALVGLLGWFDYNNRKERKSMFNALRAKNTEELAQLEAVDKLQIQVTKPKKEEEQDLVPASEITDEEFKKSIENENKGE